MNPELKTPIIDLLEPILASEGFEFVDIEHEGKGRRQTLRLLIYKVGGISVGDCQRVSKMVRPILEVHDFLMPGAGLEVASPGVDRPLVTEADFQRNIGRTIKIKMLPATGKHSKASGVLKSVEAGKILLNQLTGETTEIEISTIENAQIQLIW